MQECILCAVLLRTNSAEQHFKFPFEVHIKEDPSVANAFIFIFTPRQHTSNVSLPAHELKPSASFILIRIDIQALADALKQSTSRTKLLKTLHLHKRGFSLRQFRLRVSPQGAARK